MYSQFFATAASRSDAACQSLSYISELLHELIAMAPVEAGPTLPHLLRMAQSDATETMQRLTAKG